MEKRGRKWGKMGPILSCSIWPNLSSSSPDLYPSIGLEFSFRVMVRAIDVWDRVVRIKAMG